jgi:hypothetical protein
MTMSPKQALQNETEMVVETYGNALRALLDQVHNAQSRIDLYRERVNRDDAKTGRLFAPITDHDPHNMLSNVHELSRLAGQFQECQRLLRWFELEDNKA